MNDMMAAIKKNSRLRKKLKNLSPLALFTSYNFILFLMIGFLYIFFRS